uniref:Uncharacterized protein n=1 Tax=Xiphophorus maculatus TaxID=8083 RepID=A0A3B5QBM9_XIPMA
MSIMFARFADQLSHSDGTLRCDSSTAGTIYQYNARTLNGSRVVNFGDFAGKTVLFVNVATY